MIGCGESSFPAIRFSIGNRGQQAAPWFLVVNICGEITLGLHGRKNREEFKRHLAGVTCGVGGAGWDVGHHARPENFHFRAHPLGCLSLQDIDDFLAVGMEMEIMLLAGCKFGPHQQEVPGISERGVRHPFDMAPWEVPVFNFSIGNK